MEQDLETRALEAAAEEYGWHLPLFGARERSQMSAAISAYQRVMREGRRETTLEQQLTLLVRSFDDPKSAGEARSAIHALFQEARNGK